MTALAVPFIEPTSDFSDGLNVLRAYHERFLAQGKELLELTQAIAQQGLNRERAAEAVQLAEYYTRATQLHHQDEESVLFPLIINRSFLIDGMIERLASDHEEIEKRWAELAPHLQALGQSADPIQCLDLTQRFEQELRRHIEREDLDFFPQIETLLSPPERAEMGKRMARWRGHKISG